MNGNGEAGQENDIGQEREDRRALILTSVVVKVGHKLQILYEISVSRPQCFPLFIIHRKR
jgi:hypothetical protein